MRALFFRFLLISYLSGLVFFAFKPFRLIPGLQYSSRNSALEDRRAAVLFREHLREVDELSLLIQLKPGNVMQAGPARIVTYSRDILHQNFMVGQAGRDLVFRLRTTTTDHNGMNPHLVVPGIFTAGKQLCLVLTYDGAVSRLFVDGEFYSESPFNGGTFDNWGRNHMFAIGDEIPGGRPWTGEVARVAVYNRVLTAEEIGDAIGGEFPESSVYAYCEKGRALKSLRYRNLFVSHDSVYNGHDVIANIAGFIPLAFLFFFSFPVSIQKHRALSVFSLPLFAGALISAFFEFSQRFVEGRVPCLTDLAYNVLGTIIGCILLLIYMRSYRVVL
ncbi:VanZ family protein [Pontiella agarivorans]|uniref:VanZ family protein n=1 Tax=Pontiella agarivorans TaxID=3038953 RepID=A0ABU5MU40_9BACT|nr:VanZ family protein [Pontiella agarivorans]MDZ8117734.1 VanZ family protein [Pontiella agarivorans]